MKLGGMMMRLAASDYRTLPVPPTSAELAAHWRPYIETCIELFGATRCTYESNFPVEKMGIGWRPCGTRSSSPPRAPPRRRSSRCSAARPGECTGSTEPAAAVRRYRPDAHTMTTTRLTTPWPSPGWARV